MLAARAIQAALLVSGMLSLGCGTSAVGVDACRQIEEARCRRAPACGIPIDPPYHTAGSDVDACIRFYDTACLHGLAIADAPGGVAISSCVLAIEHNGCSVVSTPENDPACAWLVPAAPVDEASSDASDVSDASIPADAPDADGAADATSE